ncbi:thymidylate kinase [Mycobacteroides chelonae]|nr:thymidylate kinase [Mycobacteroides chelonae]
MTRRIAIVGIDGCGKSTVIARLRELAPPGLSQFSAMTCPDFHNTQNAPLQNLSRQMKAFSDGCDEIESLEMKALAMYFQMTLYGSVEQFFLDTFTPSTLVCERHPLIEVLVYGPFYLLLAQPDWDGKALEDSIRNVLDRHEPGTFDTIRDWHASEAARLNLDHDIWAMLNDVAAVVPKDVTSCLATFGERFRTTLPDIVLWLDVPPKQAAARCAARASGGVKEAHERPEFLSALRDGYLRVRGALAESFPEVAFHRIDTSDGVDIDESVRQCVREGSLFT